MKRCIYGFKQDRLRSGYGHVQHFAESFHIENEIYIRCNILETLICFVTSF